VQDVTVRGLRIAYERAGTGPALVLLHGFVGDSREWRRQIDGLSDEFTVVAWDAPGAGHSDDPPASFRMSDYAECLGLALRTLDRARSRLLRARAQLDARLESRPELAERIELVLRWLSVVVFAVLWFLEEPEPWMQRGAAEEACFLAKEWALDYAASVDELLAPSPRPRTRPRTSTSTTNSDSSACIPPAAGHSKPHAPTSLSPA